MIKEGDIYKDPKTGKDLILQPDGTSRDASIVEPPKPAGYAEVPKRVLTPQEINELNIASTRLNSGAANDKDKANIDYATKNFGYKYTAPVKEQVAPLQNTPVTVPTAVATDVRYNPDGTRILTGAEKEIDDYYATLKPKSAEEIAASEEKIRQQRLAEQKLEIDNINLMYDNLLAQINTENQGRLGSAATLSALSGQRGSASGAAEIEKTNEYNRKIVAANEAERAAKVNVIMNNYKTKISDEITKAKELAKTDAEAYLNYKAGAIDRQKTNALELRKQFLAANIKPEQLTDKDYKEIADAAGYTVDQAKAIYKSEYDNQYTEFVNAETDRLAKLDKLKAETEKLNSATALNTERNKYITKGYRYLSTMDEVNEATRRGEVISKVGDDYFAAPQTNKTKEIIRGDRRILINAITGEDIKDLGKTETKVVKGKTTKPTNYTATTIPKDVKEDLLYDFESGRSESELMKAYGDVSTSYIQSLFKKPDLNF